MHEEAFTWPVVQSVGLWELLEGSKAHVAGALGEQAEESPSAKGPPGEAGLRNCSSLNSGSARLLGRRVAASSTALLLLARG